MEGSGKEHIEVPGPAKGAYDRLKERIVQDARRDLRRSSPEYVATFQAVLLASSGDLNEAIAKAKPLLKGPLKKWPRILTGFFDLEVVRGKVSQSLVHLKQARDDVTPGADYWFSYHLDHWTFQADAFLNRCAKLSKQVIRGTIRGRDPDGWQSFEREVAAELRVIQDELGRVRHPLAHGLGGGVKGITEHWESVLAADPEFDTWPMAPNFAPIDIGRRRLLFPTLQRATLLMFAYSEAFSGRIIERIESLAS